MEKFCRKRLMKRGGKRLLALLMSVCMVGTMIPVTAKADDGHTHCICGATHNDIGDHTAGESLEWQPWGCWGSGSSFPTESGNYYLTENVNLYSQSAGWWEIEAGITINLCLNGHQFSADNIRLAQVDNSGKLVITDCVGTGYITVGNAGNNYEHCVKVNSGGEFYLFGGKLQDFNRIVENSGTFRMYGGTLFGNEGGIDYGGGVYNKGTFYMYGGTIRDCSLDSTSYYGGGGVYNEGTVYMSGGSITNCGLSMISSSATVYAQGSGVYNAGTFNMSGGSITGNEAYAAKNVGRDTYGCGFYNLGTLNLSGNVNISENVIGYTNGTPSNLLIGTEGSTNITGNLDSNATIGVTHVNGAGTVAKVAQGVTAEASCFLSDNAAWKVRKDSSGDIVLVDADLVDVEGTVKVVDTAMSGAMLSFQNESFSGSCTTDSSGNYYLTLLPGTYQVSLKNSSGQVMTIGELTVPAGEQATIDLNLTKLTGTVKDNNDIPVENVKICFGSDAVSAYSNANGEYTVLMFQDMYANGAVVSVSAESLLYASVTENVTFNPNGMTQNFVLSSIADGNTLQVSSEADLVRLANFEDQLDGKTIVLTQDIALTGQFTGIVLTGTRTIEIQGNGYTISNMTTPLFFKQTYNDNSQVLAGKVTGLYLQGDISWDCLYVGALVGDARDITIDDCSFEGSITSKYDDSGRIGGLVGGLTRGTMRNCYVSLTKLSGDNVYCAGGLCGRADTESNIIENCYVRIEEYAVTGRDNSYFLGGIFGIYAGTVKNCYVVVTGSQIPPYALGDASGAPTVNNIFAQTGSADSYSNVTQLSADVMSAKTGTTVDSQKALVDLLNTNVSTSSTYKKWYNGSDGYPCFTIPNYTITFKGGTKGTGSQEAQTVSAEELVTLPGEVYKNIDYVQKGWTTSENGAKVYELGASITLTDNMTLYPYWEAKTVATGYEVPTGLTAIYGDTLSNVSLPDGFTWNEPNTSVGDVGTHTFTATYTPTDETYGRDTNVQVEVEVKKAPAIYDTLVNKVTNLTYNRAAQELVTAGATSHGTIVYSLTGNDDYTSTVPTATNVGDYTVYYKILGDANHEDSVVGSVTVSISKTNLEGAVITLGDALIYNGEEQTQNIASVTVGTITLGAGDYTVSGNTGMDVGADYELTVTGTGNFTGTATKRFSISKKPVTGTDQTLLVKTGSAKDITYDLGKLLPEGVTGTTTYAVGTVSNTSGVLSSTPTPEDISDGKLTLHVASVDTKDLTATVKITFTNEKYEISEATLTIQTTDKLPVTLSGVTCDNRAYNGTAYAYAGTPVWKTEEGVTATGDTTVTYYKAEDPSTPVAAPTNAGSYLAVFTITSDDYVGTASYSFEITKAEITVAAKDRNIYIGDTVPDLTNPTVGTDYTVAGLCGTDVLGGTATMSYGQAPDNTKTGTYEILISGLTVPEGDNYTITFTKGTLTITTKPSSGGGSSSGGSYGGSSSGGSSGNSSITGSSEVTTGKDSGSNVTTTTSPTEVKVENGTASATVKAENVTEAIKQAEDKQSAQIVFTVSETDAGNADNIQLTITKSDVQQILDKTDADLVVATTAGDVILPQETLKEAVSAAGGNNITIEIDKVTTPTAVQKEAAGENGYIVEVTIASQDKAITTFGGNTLKIRLEIPASLTGKGVAVIHIAADGKTEKMPGKTVTEGTKQYYEFTTTHLSTFALIEETETKEEESQPEETPTVSYPKKGTILTGSKTKMMYKITKAGLTGGTVQFIGTKNKTATTITVPATVTFGGITYKVTSIAAGALKNNKVITKVVIGKNVTVIGTGAFSGCTKLKSVTIGKGVVSINSKAFYNCTSLTTLTIPASVTKIWNYAFKGCSKLKTLKINSTKLTTKTLSGLSMKGISTKTVIKVPKSKVKAYKTLFVKKGLSKKVTVKSL